MNRKQLFRRASFLYLLLLFPLAWYALFCYVPMFGIVIAFKKYSLYKGIMASPWIGLDHFKRFLTDPYFWKVLLNTLRIGTISTAIAFVLTIALALLLNELREGVFKKFAQTVSYLPHFVSVVALSNIIIIMTSPSTGIVNHIVKAFGYDPINFMIENRWFVPIYVVMILWRDLGWGTIIYLAAMASIDPELYKAAEIDGAGRLRRIWSVTLPSIMPVIGIMLILATPGILGTDFEAVLLLQQPITYNVSDVVATFVYRHGILNAEFDYATAVGFVFSIVGVVIIYISNRTARRYSEISLW